MSDDERVCTGLHTCRVLIVLLLFDLCWCSLFRIVAQSLPVHSCSSDVTTLKITFSRSGWVW